jgi:hypothetical protein
MNRASYGLIAILGTAWVVLLLTAVLGGGDDALSQVPLMGLVTVVTVAFHLRGTKRTPGGQATTPRDEGHVRAGLRGAVLIVGALSCLIALLVSVAEGELALAIPPVLLALVAYLAWRHLR